jgi:hypothetical protein
VPVCALDLPGEMVLRTKTFAVKGSPLLRWSC